MGKKHDTDPSGKFFEKFYFEKFFKKILGPKFCSSKEALRNVRSLSSEKKRTKVVRIGRGPLWSGRGTPPGGFQGHEIRLAGGRGTPPGGEAFVTHAAVGGNSFFGRRAI